MAQSITYNQGDLYFCDPDPQQPDATTTVGSELEGDHVWVIVSVPSRHRGKSVLGIPMSRHMNKAGGHLLSIPKEFIAYLPGELAMDRVALTDQIRILDKTRLRRKLGHVPQRVPTSIFDLGLDAVLGRKPLNTLSN